MVIASNRALWTLFPEGEEFQKIAQVSKSSKIHTKKTLQRLPWHRIRICAKTLHNILVIASNGALWILFPEGPKSLAWSFQSGPVRSPGPVQSGPVQFIGLVRCGPVWSGPLFFPIWISRSGPVQFLFAGPDFLVRSQSA